MTYEGMLTEHQRDRLFDASGHATSGPGWSSLMQTVETILCEHVAGVCAEIISDLNEEIDGEPVRQFRAGLVIGKEVARVHLNRYSRDAQEASHD